MSHFLQRPWLGRATRAAALSVTLTSFAVDRPPPTVTLTSVLQRAAEQSPLLVAERFDERAAEALIEQAGVRPNPTLGFIAENVLGTGAAQGVRGLEATVQASQTFERGGKREKRIALAESGREAAAHALALRRAEVLGVAAEAYVETLAAQERLALAGEPLDLARRTLATIEANVSDGAASPAQASRARAAVASARVEHLRAEAALDVARAALAATWDGDAGDIGAVAGRILLTDTLHDETDVLETLARHPRLALQDAVIARREASLALEQSQSAQDITASGGLRFLRESSDAAFVAGVSVPLPVRNRNQGNIRAARELVAGAEQQRRAIESELRVAMSVGWRTLQASHAAALTLRREALPATEEASTLVQRAHAAGELPWSDVLDAQRDLVSLRREILDAELAYATALIRYEALVTPTFDRTTELLSSP